MDDVFMSVLSEANTAGTSALTVGSYLACLATALVIGLFLAAVYMFRSSYTRSFVITLALLPAIVATIIIMVNGNIGAGIAVAGAFSLVRFRSVAGSAKEIGTIFLAMGAGLVVGMGYIAYAVLYSVILGAALVAYQLANLGARKGEPLNRTLRITIPEDLDYMGIFDDLFEKYTTAASSVSVKTTNMGSLYKLTYDIAMRPGASEKAFIDELRCRNGNLEIGISRRAETDSEL